MRRRRRRRIRWRRSRWIIDYEATGRGHIRIQRRRRRRRGVRRGGGGRKQWGATQLGGVATITMPLPPLVLVAAVATSDSEPVIQFGLGREEAMGRRSLTISYAYKDQEGGVLWRRLM